MLGASGAGADVDFDEVVGCAVDGWETKAASSSRGSRAGVSVAISVVDELFDACSFTCIGDFSTDSSLVQ